MLNLQPFAPALAVAFTIAGLIAVPVLVSAARSSDHQNSFGTESTSPDRSRVYPAFGAFGRDLQTAQQSEFFSFFHLARTAEAGSDESKVMFRPTSTQLGPLVQVQFEMKAGVIDGIDLTIDRSFVEDPQQYPFAADIISSFLRASLKDASDNRVLDTVEAVARYHPSGATAQVLVRADSAQFPASLHPLQAALVYAGAKTDSQETVSPYILTFANIGHADREVLHIRVEAENVDQ